MDEQDLERLNLKQQQAQQKIAALNTENDDLREMIKT